MLKKTIPMMVMTMQRPPTIAGAEGLVSDPLSSSALRLLHEQKNYPPRAEQGRATSTHLLPSWSSRSHRRRRRRKPREANFLTVWHFFERPAKLARGGPAPWSTRMLNPGEETCSVLVYWINQSAYRNISHFHIQTSELKSYQEVSLVNRA